MVKERTQHPEPPDDRPGENSWFARGADDEELMNMLSSSAVDEILSEQEAELGASRLALDEADWEDESFDPAESAMSPAELDEFLADSFESPSQDPQAPVADADDEQTEAAGDAAAPAEDEIALAEELAVLLGEQWTAIETAGPEGVEERPDQSVAIGPVPDGGEAALPAPRVDEGDTSDEEDAIVNQDELDELLADGGLTGVNSSPPASADQAEISEMGESEESPEFTAEARTTEEETSPPLAADSSPVAELEDRDDSGDRQGLVSQEDLDALLGTHYAQEGPRRKRFVPIANPAGLSDLEGAASTDDIEALFAQDVDSLPETSRERTNREARKPAPEVEVDSAEMDAILGDVQHQNEEQGRPRLKAPSGAVTQEDLDRLFRTDAPTELESTDEPIASSKAPEDAAEDSPPASSPDDGIATIGIQAGLPSGEELELLLAELDEAGGGHVVPSAGASPQSGETSEEPTDAVEPEALSGPLSQDDLDALFDELGDADAPGGAETADAPAAAPLEPEVQAAAESEPEALSGPLSQDDLDALFDELGDTGTAAQQHPAPETSGPEPEPEALEGALSQDALDELLASAAGELNEDDAAPADVELEDDGPAATAAAMEVDRSAFSPQEEEEDSADVPASMTTTSGMLSQEDLDALLKEASTGAAAAAAMAGASADAEDATEPEKLSPDELDEMLSQAVVDEGEADEGLDDEEDLQAILARQQAEHPDNPGDVGQDAGVDGRESAALLDASSTEGKAPVSTLAELDKLLSDRAKNGVIDPDERSVSQMGSGQGGYIVKGEVDGEADGIVLPAAGEEPASQGITVAGEADAASEGITVTGEGAAVSKAVVVGPDDEEDDEDDLTSSILAASSTAKLKAREQAKSKQAAQRAKLGLDAPPSNDAASSAEDDDEPDDGLDLDPLPTAGEERPGAMRRVPTLATMAFYQGVELLNRPFGNLSPTLKEILGYVGFALLLGSLLTFLGIMIRT